MCLLIVLSIIEISSMEDIYTTSINGSTIDEAPQVYKPMAEIMEAIKPTADIM